MGDVIRSALWAKPNPGGAGRPPIMAGAPMDYSPNTYRLPSGLYVAPAFGSNVPLLRGKSGSEPGVGEDYVHFPYVDTDGILRLKGLYTGDTDDVIACDDCLVGSFAVISTPGVALVNPPPPLEDTPENCVDNAARDIIIGFAAASQVRDVPYQTCSYAANRFTIDWNFPDPTVNLTSTVRTCGNIVVKTGTGGRVRVVIDFTTGYVSMQADVIGLEGHVVDGEVVSFGGAGIKTSDAFVVDGGLPAGCGHLDLVNNVSHEGRYSSNEAIDLMMSASIL